MTPDRPLEKPLTRRQMLGVIASASAAGAAIAAGCSDDESTPQATDTPGATTGATATSPAAATGTPAPSELSCVVSPEQTEGPFFVDEILDRSDIRSDPETGEVSEGVPFTLRMRVFQVEDGACVPLDGAVVDVWHCDAEGRYSDVAANDTVGLQFLRGYQLTDENGAVRFTTIYPGWYTGRAVHIHVKVRTDPASERGFEFTSQLYFDDTLTDQVFAQAPYDSRGERDTRNADDGIYENGGDQMLLAVTPDGAGYAGAIDIGVLIS